MKNGQTQLRVTASMPLMDFLLAKMGGMSRTAVKALLTHQQVTVNGRVVTLFNHALHVNDLVCVTKNRPLTTNKLHPLLKLVYEDDYLLVVAKKEGLLTVATSPESRETTVFSILKNYVRQTNTRNGVFVVHRLDRETSGLLVFAKQRDLQRFMRDNWRTVVTNRAYVALVEGNVQPTTDTIVSWLTENPKTTRVYSSFHDNGGKKSITHYTKIEGNNNYSLLELHLETGRTNQIRVQMAAIGHPVVGDRKYGSGSSPVVNRLALHAYTLDFVHPVTHQPLHFEQPVPPDFRLPHD
ncbi:MAG: RluA family pseudouridine synthase [Paludibacteraceae bacterium]